MARATNGPAPRRPLDADGVREVLRDRGLRYSRPREVILRYLTERDRHLSAEGLYAALKAQGDELSLSTVYLNLGVLAGAGLVREFVGAGGEALYDSNVSHHYHLICRESGEVRDVPVPTIDGMPLGAYLQDYVERLTGWQVEEPRVTLRGCAPRGSLGATSVADRSSRED
ncbi:MAG: transcriptional repressor [Trueperaceae bacterium]|nr:transcriptional repressor [Trueperaceae bacterium]